MTSANGMGFTSRQVARVKAALIGGKVPVTVAARRKESAHDSKPKTTTKNILFEQRVDRGAEKRAQEWAYPVYPVPVVREARDSGGTERTRSVHCSARVQNGEQMARKERQADTDGGKWSGVVLLSGEHEYGEHERSGDEHLDEHALRGINLRA